MLTGRKATAPRCPLKGLLSTKASTIAVVFIILIPAKAKLLQNHPTHRPIGLYKLDLYQHARELACDITYTGFTFELFKNGHINPTPSL
jgi:hypothetical protein